MLNVWVQMRSQKVPVVQMCSSNGSQMEAILCEFAVAGCQAVHVDSEQILGPGRSSNSPMSWFNDERSVGLL